MRGDSTRRALWPAADKLYEAFHLGFRRAATVAVPASIETSQATMTQLVRELRWATSARTDRRKELEGAQIPAFLAEAVYKQGRDDEAERLTEVSEELAAADDLVPQVLWRSVRAKILARRGELEQAEELGREVVELADNTDFPDLKASTSLDLAEVLDAAGKTDEAMELVDRARQVYERKGNVVAAQQSGLRSAHPTRSGGENG